MNTPSHVAASLLAWRSEQGWLAVNAIVVGAILPDLPMFGFYAYQKSVGRSEHAIWGELYFDPTWQWVFDIFNSIPIAAVAAVVCYFAGARWGVLLASSAMLHMACDLPVHNDDAHRHFLPLTNWRFESPVSYWDPRHYGVYFAISELIFALTACAFVSRRAPSAPMRAAAVATLTLYFLAIGLALCFWVSQVRIRCPRPRPLAAWAIAPVRTSVPAP